MICHKWWFLLIILALGTLRQEGVLKLEVGQGSRGTPCFNKLKSFMSSQGRCGPMEFGTQFQFSASSQC